MIIQECSDNQPPIEFHTNGTATVVRTSPFSGKTHAADIKLDKTQYADWRAGQLMQLAMPHLTADEREFIMTGITPAEWNDTFR